MTSPITLPLPQACRALGTADFEQTLSAELAQHQNALPLERGLELGGWPEYLDLRVLRSEDRPGGWGALIEVRFREVLAGGCPAGIISNERSLTFWSEFDQPSGVARLTLVEPADDRMHD